MRQLSSRSRRPDEESDDESTVAVSPLLGGLGLVAVLAGAAIVIAPGLGAGLDPGYLIVIAVGAALILAGLHRLWSRLFTSVTSATTPAVEERTTVSVPGADVDALLARTPRNSADRIQQRTALRRRLHAVAVAVVADRLEIDEATAREHVAAGTWTDDPEAAALLAPEDVDTSVRSRLTAVLPGRSALARRLRRTVAELARMAGEEGGDAAEFDVTVADPSDPTPVGCRATERWNGLAALSLLAVGVGVLYTEPSLVLGGGVLAGVGGYAAAVPAPDPDLAIERTIEPTEPRPGESVTVTVEIENVGEAVQPDLRFVDGVPEGVRVADGSPRHGTALRPGATTTYRYAIEAARGSHEFGTPSLVARNASGTIERVSEPAVAGDDAVTYDVAAALELTVPLRKHASRHVGRVLTDVGGTGTEFHSVREYRTGDPQTRIDWNRAARGSGLATLQFREERSATVVVLIDARRPAYVAPDGEAASAVDRSVLAAAQVVSALLDSDDRVGVGSLAPRRCWLSPGAGPTHRARAHDLLATDEAFAPAPPDAPYYLRINLSALRKRLPSEAQLVIFSPLSDDDAVEIVRRLEASGYPVTLVSPDATGGGTPGRGLAGLERSIRLSQLRSAKVRVVDWDPGEPFALALTNASKRWS